MLVFVVLGVIAFGVLLARQLGQSTAVADLVESTDRQMLASMALPEAAAGAEIDPQDEAFYINHAYDSVSASLAGDAIVVKAGASSESAALATVQAFLDQYLPARAAAALDVYEAAHARSEKLADFFDSEVVRIEEQLANTAISDPARNELAVQHSDIASDAARNRADADAYETLLEGSGPIALKTPPRIEDTSLTTRALSPLLALFALVAVGIVQAWMRDGDGSEPGA